MIDRIVVVNDISEPKGGATALAISSALAFRQRGVAVTYLTGDQGDNQALADAGVQMVALGASRLNSSKRSSALINGLYNSAARELVAAWIGENDGPGTIYHLHGWSQILSPSIFFALNAVRDRLVFSAHDFFLVCPNGSYSVLKTGAPCGLVPLSMQCLASQCDRQNYGHKIWRSVRQAIHRTAYQPGTSPPVLAIHENMRGYLTRGGIPSNAIITLPNPVTPYASTRIMAERNKFALFVGRVEVTKGADLAAAACRRAGVPLRLIGDGELRVKLEAEYPEFEFLGRQPSTAIPAHAAQARVLLMPSRYPEPYGLVAAEALWSGLPVIAADTAFLTADIERANAGRGVAPRDITKFASILSELFSNDALCMEMSTNAFDHTRHIGLSLVEWIDRLVDIYEKRLNSGAERNIANAETSAVPG